MLGRRATAARLGAHLDLAPVARRRPAAHTPAMPRTPSASPAAVPFQARSVCGCAAAASAGPRTRKAYIALGSNVGDRVAMIERACREMDARGIRVKRTSSLWETAPMYVVDQDPFVNGACEVCSPIPLLKSRNAVPVRLTARRWKRSSSP